MSAESTIALSLISHTNTGKTTLARTLLRREVGDVRDAPHVLRHDRVHRIPRQRIVTIASRPSW